MEIDISRISHSIRRLFWIPILGALVMGLLGMGAGVALPNTYTATTQLMVTAQLTGPSVLGDDGSPATFKALVTSGPVLDKVILELGLDENREELEEMITVEIVPGTQMIDISVTSDNPQYSSDVANSLSRNMLTTATDISIGELQRHLDDLRMQSNTTRDQITVMDTRLETIDTEENTDNSEAQAEIAQIKRDRLRLSQNLSDLDATIRTLSTSLSMSSIPVIISDYAFPPENPDDGNAILLGVLGVLVGGMIGLGLLLYFALTDRRVRAVEDIVSPPILGKYSSEGLLGDEASAQFGLMVGKILASQRDYGIGEMKVVSARKMDAVPAITQHLQTNLEGEAVTVTPANGILDDATALRAMAGTQAIVVVAHKAVTKIDDLDEVSEIAQLMNARVLGTVVLE